MAKAVAESVVPSANPIGDMGDNSNPLITLSTAHCRFERHQMKRLFWITIGVTITTWLLGCGNDGNDDANEGQLPTGRNYKQGMRDFVRGMSAYAKGINPDFIVIPQNGHQLITDNGRETGSPALTYLHAIDGVGREDLFYGYDDDNIATPISARNHMIAFLEIASRHGVEVLVTDYCWTETFMADSYRQNAARGYISFAADERELLHIPRYPTTPYNVNLSNITSLPEAQNFLYLLNLDNYRQKTAFIRAIERTNYDLVITDLFYEDTEQLTSSDIAALKVKANGRTRLVIAYMSIGEAEDYRYYWQTQWEANPPSWLSEENPDWPGNYKVRYWDEDWQGMIYGSGNSYLKKILDAGFDGVYLDIIDAFEFFESQVEQGE
ncbi:MAG: endo alpha-1,4 polygalactosaminidase [Candidatus Poribacteria bacterium]|nr:endo alpha-1,4 polygalactosaminidase [Candidatus Poribacteria bacterium]